MKNDLFDEQSIKVLLAQENWRIIGSLFAEEVDFIHNPTHLKWMRTHSESHQAREVLIALKGAGLYGYQGRIYPCLPGTIMLFNTYESHDNYYPPGCSEVLHLWLTIFEHDVVARVLHAREGKVRNMGYPLVLSGSTTACLLSSTWDELAENPNLPPAFRRAKLLAALSALLLHSVEWGFGKTAARSQSNFQRQVIETILRHVAKTAGRDVPLAEAARLAGYSKFHFLRLFKRETGQTFHEYVDGCRIKKVAAMLQERRPKTEISKTLGFSHPSTLLRWMKSNAKNI